MSKVLATVAKVAAIVATVALVVAAVATGNPALVALAIKIGTIATAVSTVASLGSQFLAQPPPARGSVSQILIGASSPAPYPMGRTMLGGVLAHDRGYGTPIGDTPNPYRSQVIILSAVRIQSIEATLADYNTVSFSAGAATGYFSGFLNRSTQLGLMPEAAALTGPHGAIPEWGASHKLSGKAAVLLTAKFDRKGKIFANGMPQWGHIVEGVWAYDPRADSTYPGGSGAQRIGNETTWAYTVNPALHALTYALGRRQNGKLVFGPGYSVGSVDIATIVAWANVCDANGWSVSGVIYEPGDAWANLKLICAAGGGEPVAEPVLTWRYRAPRVPLYTITPEDLADGEIVVPAMQSRRSRLNTIIPEYRSEAHSWDMVHALAVTDAAYVTEDGEERPEVFRLECVSNVNQAAQLAAYRLTDAREFGPIELNCKPHLGDFKPGQVLDTAIPEAGLAGVDVLILNKAVDPQTGQVKLTVASETYAKHAFALGRTGTAPPTPSIRTNAEIDAVAGALATPIGYKSSVIRLANLVGGVHPLAAVDAGVTATINIAANEWDYPEPEPNVTRALGSITGLLFSTIYYAYFDDESLTATSVTYGATTSYDAARSSTTANPFRHYLGSITTPADGGGGTGGGGGGGGGGSGPIP